ncbi:hypothetical protein JTE90_024191 [Oedothorax gibbosus]|uniref:Selenoprotein O n=1 Tax=Oedothorax gibbosus TaxID=931172 RepID=A0AAV6UEK5_9ARAC|nr:hypothetical protein JTE90_024191 [Oedothorax gibbosus]
MSSLDFLKFDNRAINRLPIDSVQENYVRTVNGACFSKVSPTPVENPKLVAHSRSALSLLDMTTDMIEDEEFVECFAGNKILPGSEPAAHCYCGHQFGYFSGQLGDGAAMYLGEVLNSKNERWEIQLKGAGLTPYSRTADGRKVLRSSIREFLCSEAMHFLGIPTSRAGTCITSDSKVIRDIFYDGHPIKENCSIVLRIAPTFIRFGSFEIFKTLDHMTGRVGPSVGRVDILHTMLDYVIETFFPNIHDPAKNKVDMYAEFFKEVVLRTARLVAQWQSVGFCHGVLNTDNMSIVGLTLDYGPYGFLDMYNPNHICNASDEGGRYTFIKQPSICLWNLQKLAEALQQALPLAVSTPLLDLYEQEFETTYMKIMRSKIGLVATELSEDKKLIEDLFDTMEKTSADFTNTFLCLAHIDATDSIKLEESIELTKEKLLENCYPLEVLLNYYRPDINAAQLETFKAIAAAHPSFIEQLGRAGMSIQKVLTQLKRVEEFEGLTQDDKLKKDAKLWDSWLKTYKIRIEKDLKGFQSDTSTYNENRLSVMKKQNPRFILRNYIAQATIEKAENGDFSGVKELMDALEDPYNHSYSEISSQSYPSSTAEENKNDVASSFHMIFVNGTTFNFWCLFIESLC